MRRRTPVRPAVRTRQVAPMRRREASRPVSRVLYGLRAEARKRGSHSSGAALARSLLQPTRTTNPETGRDPLRHPLSFLFGLAPGGVCRAVAVAGNAVGSYPTLSPLPLPGGLLSVALSLGSPPPDVIRHRVSAEPGLSSPRCLSAVRGAAARPTGRHRIHERAAHFQPKEPLPAPLAPSAASATCKGRGAMPSAVFRQGRKQPMQCLDGRRVGNGIHPRGPEMPLEGAHCGSRPGVELAADLDLVAVEGEQRL